MRKKLSLIAALIAFFAMTAVTFAANTAQINVTSEPITWKAQCDKAGAISFSFDAGTTFVSGDIITGDLPMNVSLCKNIDFIAGIRRAGSDPQPYSGVQGTLAPYAADIDFGSVVGGSLPAIGTDASGPLTGDGYLTSTGGGIVFWVKGTVKSQRITITILSDSNRTTGIDRIETTSPPSTTFVANPAIDPLKAKLVLNILDQKVYTSDSGLFTDRNIANAPAATYINRTEQAENTLCINVSHADFNNEYVKMSFDSKADKYTWIPSDPQIAHVVPQKEIELAPCIKPECGYIPTPVAGSQGNTAGSCIPINNEAGNGIGTDLSSFAGVQDGYCAGTHRNNRMILQNTKGIFDTGIYQIQLEILVDGKTGDQGAYFAGPIGYAATTTLPLACNATSTSLDTIYYNAADDSSLYQLDAAGTVNTNLAPLSDIDCTIATANNKITKVRTKETTLFNGNDHDFLFVDIPNIVWDASLFTEGEKLTVKVTLMKAPCGTLISRELCIGTRGCPLPVDPNACRTFTRIYPFFGKEADYMNVLGITNTTSGTLTFAVTVYEKDGDKFTGSIVVPKNTVQATILANLPSAALVPGGTGTGILGDAQSYAEVSVTVKGQTAAPFIGFIYLFDKVKLGQSFSTTQDDPIVGVPVSPCPAGL